TSPPSGRSITLLLARLWAHIAAPYLDEELAEGVNPSRNLPLAVRAEQITEPKARRIVADTLRSSVRRAGLPGGLDARAPLDDRTILLCRDQIVRLADHIVSMEHPSARGVAIARQLTFDGHSPLYWKPRQNGEGPEKLANTIHTAQAALGVAADFDESELVAA